MPRSRLSIAFVTFGNVAGAAAQWYLIWLFAQQSGPSAVGQYSTLIALMTPVFVACELGLRSIWVTLRQRIRWTVYVGMRIFGVLAAVSILTVLVAAADIDFDGSLPTALLALKICDSISDLFFARLQKAERLLAFGTVLLFRAVAIAASATLVMFASGAIVVAIWGAACMSAVATAITVTIAISKRTASMTPGPSSTDMGLGQQVRTLLRAGVPLSIMHGIYSVLSYVPLSVVAWFGTTEDVGRYASAAYLVVFANLVGASVETVMLPNFRRLVETSGRPVLNRLVLYRSAFIAASLAPLVVLALFVGPWLITTVYGAAFVLSRTAVLFLALAAVCTLPTYLMSATLLVLNRYWATAIVGATSIVFALICGIIAGATGMGPVEAGCLVLLTGSITRFGGEWALSRSRPHQHQQALREAPDTIPAPDRRASESA